MPIWGRLADHLGRRPAYLIGLAVFLVGSALAGLSHSMEQLIAFRALQGIGAGSLITIGMTIVGDLYGMERRAKMQGYFSSVWGVASLVGPLIGGVLTDRVSWRWVFYVNIPVGLLAAAAIAAGLRDEVRIRARTAFDLVGMTVFVAAISSFLVGLLEAGGSEPWMRPVGVGLLALSGALLIAFVVIERRAVEPVIPLGLFRNPIVRAAAVTGLLSGMASTCRRWWAAPPRRPDGC
jgi:multidrug resistance protein